MEAVTEVTNPHPPSDVQPDPGEEEAMAHTVADEDDLISKNRGCESENRMRHIDYRMT